MVKKYIQSNRSWSIKALSIARNLYLKNLDDKFYANYLVKVVLSNL